MGVMRMNMLAFEITPHVGVGPVKLGMQIHDVEAVLGKPEHVRDNRYSYLSGFMVDFDETGKVEFIELANSQLFQTTFNGINLHGVTATEAVNFVSEYDSYDRNDPEVGYSYIFKRLQLSLWRGTMPENEADDDGKYFEAVGVATDGYFE
jgi:hypothetical protein